MRDKESEYILKSNEIDQDYAFHEVLHQASILRIIYPKLTLEEAIEKGWQAVITPNLFLHDNANDVVKAATETILDWILPDDLADWPAAYLDTLSAEDFIMLP
jgi:hypothetical protein